MGDPSFLEGGEITQNRYKEQLIIRNHGSFMIGSKQGVEKVAVGRNPWDPGILTLPQDSSDMLGVRLVETSALPRFTSRLQLVVGRDEQGSFYVENMSKYVDERLTGVPIIVSAPHFQEPITLFPKGRSGGSDTRSPLGGTAKALKDVNIKWGDEYKGAYFYNLTVEKATSDASGWEAQIRYEIIKPRR